MVQFFSWDPHGETDYVADEWSWFNNKGKIGEISCSKTQPHAWYCFAMALRCKTGTSSFVSENKAEEIKIRRPGMRFALLVLYLYDVWYVDSLMGCHVSGSITCYLTPFGCCPSQYYLFSSWASWALHWFYFFLTCCCLSQCYLQLGTVFSSSLQYLFFGLFLAMRHVITRTETSVLMTCLAILPLRLRCAVVEAGCVYQTVCAC